MFTLLFRPPSSRTVSYLERQKDATYITVSSRPTPESEPGVHVVKSMSLKAAIAKGQIIRLEEGNKTGEPVKPGAFEVNKFFRRLSFKHQVRRVRYSQTGLLKGCVQWCARSVWWISVINLCNCAALFSDSALCHRKPCNLKDSRMGERDKSLWTAVH